MQIDPRAFHAAVQARTQLLPRVKIFTIGGTPARASELRHALFGGDHFRFDDAEGGLVWSFDGAPPSGGILVDEVPHEQIVFHSLDALAGDPEAQLQLVSLQKVSDAARHRIAGMVARASAAMLGSDARLTPAGLLVDALAQVAIAFGLRPDTADHARSERAKEVAAMVEPVLATAGSPDRAAFVAICAAFEDTCASGGGIGHFANAVAAALREN